MVMVWEFGLFSLLYPILAALTDWNNWTEIYYMRHKGKHATKRPMQILQSLSTRQHCFMAALQGISAGCFGTGQQHAHIHSQQASTESLCQWMAVTGPWPYMNFLVYQLQPLVLLKIGAIVKGHMPTPSHARWEVILWKWHKRPRIRDRL